MSNKTLSFAVAVLLTVQLLIIKQLLHEQDNVRYAYDLCFLELSLTGPQSLDARSIRDTCRDKARRSL